MVSNIRKRFVLLVLITVLATMAYADENESISRELPFNVFAEDVVNSSIIWWRPYRVIYDPNKVFQIQQKLNAVSKEQAYTINLDFARDDELSAFVFPVLAVEQTKGIILLNRYLQEYKKGRPLDDSWLLIIASLGRSPTEEAGIILEQELNRVIEKYDPHIHVKDFKETKIQIKKQKDERIPVLDAMMANLACQGKLNSTKILELEQRFTQDPFLKKICWHDGMNWVLRYVGEEAVSRILIEGLSMCSEQELLNATNMQPSSDRIMLILNFISSSNDIWPLAKNILITQSEQMKGSVLDLLLVNYAFIMTYEAEENNGYYTIDDKLSHLYMNRNLDGRKSFQYAAEILKACTNSKANPEWQAFLEQKALQLDAESRKSAVHLINRIHGISELPKQSYEKLDPEKVYKRLSDPGIYMVGF
jgi:hypothetical protein